MTTELVDAANEQDTKKVKELIEQHAELNTQDSEGRTALMIATYNNEAPTVKALLDAEADVDIQDNIRKLKFTFI